MNDNDILIARKSEGTCKTVVIDGDTADFERQNNRVKDRQKAEADKARAKEAKAKQYEAYMARMAAAEQAKRRKRVHMTIGLVLSVGALMAMTLTGLMHAVVGMVFIAGDAAACGWMLGRNR